MEKMHENTSKLPRFEDGTPCKPPGEWDYLQTSKVGGSDSKHLRGIGGVSNDFIICCEGV